MQVRKIFQRLITAKPVEQVKNSIPPCPVVYDAKNVTENEYKEYVHWLAKNNINRTFREPDRFVTEAERELQAKKKAELEEYRKFVRYLSENNINRTFYC